MTDLTTVVSVMSFFVFMCASLDNQAAERRAATIVCPVFLPWGGGGSIYIRHLYVTDEFLYLSWCDIRVLWLVVGDGERTKQVARHNPDISSSLPSPKTTNTGFQ
jgi:hypothetical protein